MEEKASLGLQIGLCARVRPVTVVKFLWRQSARAREGETARSGQAQR